MVLLVDDQAMVAETVRRMLADQRDVNFHYCDSPAEAIGTAERIKPSMSFLPQGNSDSVGVQIYFDANMFDESRVRRLADQYIRLLFMACADPDCRISKLVSDERA